MYIYLVTTDQFHMIYSTYNSTICIQIVVKAVWHTYDVIIMNTSYCDIQKNHSM